MTAKIPTPMPTGIERPPAPAAPPPKKQIETEGGWIWWLKQLRENSRGGDLTIDALLQLYIKGVKWEDVK